MRKKTFATPSFLIFTSLFLLAGCLSNPSQPDPLETQNSQSSQTISKQKPKIGLALGGGAARGFAHIGVIKILESHGIIADYVAGTSAGAVVGALYASGNDAFAMQKIAHQLDEKIFADWTIAGRGALKGEALQAFVNEQVGNRALERLKKPLAVVATDLNSGERVVFRTGETGLAVRASAAVPGIFQPTPIMTKSGGRNYVDGGLTSPIPVQAVREMGAEIVIAVDISDNPAGQSTHNLLSILWQTTTIMGKIIASNELKSADIVIRPKLPRVKSWDFKSRNEAMLEGEKAAQAALPIILKKLER